MTQSPDTSEIRSRLAFGVNDACVVTGLGRSFLYKEIGAGRLPVCKVGSRTLIFAADLRAWLETFKNKAV